MLTAASPAFDLSRSSDRRHVRRAAVGFALVPPTEPELRLVHRWLDCWRGVGDVVRGTTRQGWGTALRENRTLPDRGPPESRSSRRARARGQSADARRRRKKSESQADAIRDSLRFRGIHQSHRITVLELGREQRARASYDAEQNGPALERAAGPDGVLG